jgi:PPOX class probable F420-dependent enzyme
VYTRAKTSPLQALEGEKYLSLTTFRRDGTAVATPVWFVADEGRLLVWSFASSHKVKRLRRDGRVRVAACDFRGTEHGPTWDGSARILPPSTAAPVQRLLKNKYPVARRLLAWTTTLLRRLQRRPEAPSAYIEIALH